MHKVLAHKARTLILMRCKLCRFDAGALPDQRRPFVILRANIIWCGLIGSVLWLGCSMNM